MIRPMYSALVCGVVLVATTFPAQAGVISFFNNATYVQPSEEAGRLRSELVGLGHTVNDFTGITAADFTAAFASGEVVIPELEVRDLTLDLTATARSAIANAVNAGGGLISSDGANTNFLNSTFGFSLSGAVGAGVTNLNTVAAAGTAFAGGPATLPSSNAVNAVSSASLPGGALNLYSASGRTSVFAASVGSGDVVWFGFDWYETPAPTLWNDVLDRAVAHSSTPVPEPTSLALWSGLGLMGLIAVRRRRKVA